MRQEATTAEWKKLYELAEQYVKMKPWELFTNEEMICVSFSDVDRAYFTIMGNGGMEYGFGMYVGDIAFREMQLQIFDPQGSEYSLYMQNCVVMFMDRKEEVPSEQRKVLQEIGRDYGRGRKWIYFETHTRGYAPFIPDQEDVLNTIRFLEKLLEALPQMEKFKPRGMHLVGQGFVYALQQTEWKVGVTVWNQKELRKLPFEVQSTGVKEEAATWKKLKAEWEVDIHLLHTIINDEKYDRPVYPYLLLVLEHRCGKVVYQQQLTPEDEPGMLCSYMTGLMKEQGIPKKILVSGETMQQVFSPLTTTIGVPVEKDRLKHMKEFGETMQKHLFGQDIDSGESMLKSLGIKEEEIEALLEMSGAETEEELVQMLGERVRSMFGNGMDDEIPFGNSEYDDKAFWDAEDEEGYDLVWQDPGSMRERIRLINDFFEYTYAYTEDSDEDEEEWDEELAPGMIDAEWCDDWRNIISQCTVEKLKEMAKILGTHSGAKKAQIAAGVADALMEKPARVKELLSKEELSLMKHLRELINKKDFDPSDLFPYTRETVISLVEKGMADIRYGHDFMELYLTFRIPKEMKGLRL